MEGAQSKEWGGGGEIRDNTVQNWIVGRGSDLVKTLPRISQGLSVGVRVV